MIKHRVCRSPWTGRIQCLWVRPQCMGIISPWPWPWRQSPSLWIVKLIHVNIPGVNFNWASVFCIQGCCYMLTLRTHSDSARHCACPQCISPHDATRYLTTLQMCRHMRIRFILKLCSRDYVHKCPPPCNIHRHCTEPYVSVLTTADSHGKSTQLSTLVKTCLISVDCSLVLRTMWTQQYFWMASYALLRVLQLCNYIHF